MNTVICHSHAHLKLTDYNTQTGKFFMHQYFDIKFGYYGNTIL